MLNLKTLSRNFTLAGWAAALSYLFAFGMPDILREALLGLAMGLWLVGIVIAMWDAKHPEHDD